MYEIDLDDTDVPLPHNTPLVLVVDALGRSMPFRVAKDVYSSLLKTALRAFWFQRNGVALHSTVDGYTFDRPRTLHPDDVPLFWTSTRLAETGNSDIGGLVDKLGWSTIAAGATTKPCDAWGGWMDAGDWDTRGAHMKAGRELLLLFDRFPTFFAALELELPGESGDGVPDILQQVLWITDYHSRLQNAEGGVGGGVETLQHPKIGERSFSNSQVWYCYSPDAWTTFHFAGTAAWLSRLLAPFDPTKAADLAARATKAYGWAKAHKADPLPGPAEFQRRHGNSLQDTQATAAVQLLAMGGVPDAALLNDFLATERCSTVLVAGDQVNGIEAAALFARLPSSLQGSGSLPQTCATALATLPGLITTSMDASSFRMGMASFMPPFSLAVSESLSFLTRPLASKDTLDQTLLDYLGQAHDYTLGANPGNTVYLTDGGVPGLVGSRAISSVLRVDSHNMAGQVAPPGICVTGPGDPGIIGGFTAGGLSTASQYFPSLATPVYPPDKSWPAAEYYHMYAFQAEFTPHGTMGPTAMNLGVYVAGMHEQGFATAPATATHTTTANVTAASVSTSAASATTDTVTQVPQVLPANATHTTTANITAASVSTSATNATTDTIPTTTAGGNTSLACVATRPNYALVLVLATIIVVSTIGFEWHV